MSEFMGLSAQIEHVNKKTAYEKLRTTLKRLKVIEPDPMDELGALMEALSANLASSFGKPDTLMVDPNFFNALKSLDKDSEK